MAKQTHKQVAKLAFRFVLTIGIVNLFADMTYQGARGITGPFSGITGSERGSRWLHRRWRRNAGLWTANRSRVISPTSLASIGSLVGYVINMIAVPFLALAGNWPIAAALMITERTGRGIRKPATDAMLSYAGKAIGSGWVFGLNEGLDQAGATVGPLIVALVLYEKNSYRFGFGVLIISSFRA